MANIASKFFGNGKARTKSYVNVNNTIDSLSPAGGSSSNGLNKNHAQQKQIVQIINEASHNMLDKVKELAQANPEILKVKDKDGNSLIVRTVASKHNTSEVVEYLLEKGANVNDKDRIEIQDPNITFTYYGENFTVNKNQIKKTPGKQEWKAFLPDGKFIVLQDNPLNNISYVFVPGRPLLSIAVSLGKVETAKILIDKKADLELRDNEGMTPLAIAASKSDVDMVNLLLERGANVNAVDKHGRSVFFHAVNGITATDKRSDKPQDKIQKDKITIAKTIANHPDHNSEHLVGIIFDKDIQRNILTLHIVSTLGSLTLLEKILEKRGINASVLRDEKYKDDSGRSIFFTASLSFQYRMVSFLLSNNFNINETDKQGMSVVHYLLAQASDKSLDEKTRSSALQMAKKITTNPSFNPQHFLKLLAAKGNSVLHLAVTCDSSPDVIRMILNRLEKSDKETLLDTKNKEKKTPLMVAVENYNLEAVRTLLELGANPNIKNQRVSGEIIDPNDPAMKIPVYEDHQTPLELAKYLKSSLEKNLEKLPKFVKNDSEKIKEIKANLRINAQIIDLLAAAVIKSQDSKQNGYHTRSIQDSRSTSSSATDRGSDTSSLVKGQRPDKDRFFDGERSNRTLPKGKPPKIERKDTFVLYSEELGDTKSALILAAAYGYLEEMKQIISKDKTLIETKDKASGKSLLAIAATYCQSEVVDYLLEQGADVNAGAADHSNSILLQINHSNNPGRTPVLFYAVCQTDINHVENVNYSDFPKGAKAKKTRIEIAKKIAKTENHKTKNFDYGIQILDKNKKVLVSTTMLHEFAALGSVELLEMALSELPDLTSSLESKNIDGLSPLSLSAISLHAAAVKYLISKGADVNCPDNIKPSLLYRVATKATGDDKKAAIEIFKLIAEKEQYSWDKFIDADSEGKTFLSIAAENLDVESWNLIKSKFNDAGALNQLKVALNMKDCHGKKPLDYAIAAKNDVIATHITNIMANLHLDEGDDIVGIELLDVDSSEDEQPSYVLTHTLTSRKSDVVAMTTHSEITEKFNIAEYINYNLEDRDLTDEEKALFNNTLEKLDYKFYKESHLLLFIELMKEVKEDGSEVFPEKITEENIENALNIAIDMLTEITQSQQADRTSCDLTSRTSSGRQ